MNEIEPIDQSCAEDDQPQHSLNLIKRPIQVEADEIFLMVEVLCEYLAN